MQEASFMKGCEAIGEAALNAGCRHFYAYPATPATDLVEFMARRLPGSGGVFVQADSDICALGMVYGAAAAGQRVMTALASPGSGLCQESISHLAASELPCVLIQLSRSGPGQGNVLPSQGDYFQATKCGPGDYHLLVLAPGSVQEAAELTRLAFHLADKYRNPVMILSDGALGQLSERVEFSQPDLGPLPDNHWAVAGAEGRPRRVVSSSCFSVSELAEHNLKLKGKYRDMACDHTLFEVYEGQDAKIMLVAFGTVARVAAKVVDKLRAEGLPVGLMRPISLFPFPTDALKERISQVDAFLVVEMNLGQMLEDVERALLGQRPIEFLGITGGALPTPAQMSAALKETWEKHC
jgi:2-oxoglutarate ferredoxin oxidoreductase subunit alpha